ncbi:hypothetical protein L7F22_004543 [Adiantum nelumboides]|nr:hypothetical protein [Adiantum nelumboides]
MRLGGRSSSSLPTLSVHGSWRRRRACTAAAPDFFLPRLTASPAPLWLLGWNIGQATMITRTLVLAANSTFNEASASSTNTSFRPGHGCWQRKRAIAAGGCGTVSLAIDNATGREFVIKKVPYNSDAVSALLKSKHAILQKLSVCTHSIECFGSDVDIDEEGK